MWVSVIMLFIIGTIIFLLDKKKKTEDELSKNSTTIIKGLLAMGIFFHHVSQGLGAPNSIITAFIFFGNLFVGGFLFFSGYGLLKSYILKGKEYRKSFIIKRLIPLIIPFIILSCVIFIENRIVGIGNTSVTEFLYSFINMSPYVTVFWYVYVILFFYIAYYLLMVIVEKEKVIPYLMLILSCIATYICFKKAIPYWWYHAILALPIGMLYCLYEKKISKIVTSKYARSIALCAVTFIISTHYLTIGNYYLRFYKSIFVELIQILSLCFIFVFVAKKYELKNKFFKLIGSISYEIYLTQCFVFPISIYILSRTIGLNDVTYFITSSILVVIVAKLFNMLHQFIFKYIFRIQKH